MKKYMLLLMTILTVSAYAQGKFSSADYDNLKELKGTDYVVTSVESWAKVTKLSACLLFVNTRTGEQHRIDFPKDAYVERVEQVKLDSLGINRVVVTAKTVDLNGNRSINWNDPRQVMVLSTDGKEKMQTEDRFFSVSWMLNNQTGAIVVTGKLDSNGNGKLDKEDENAIVVYDLKTMKQVGGH